MSSNTFQIDEEIDKLVDKYTEELKIRIKKAIIRSEKIVLKQYITSQRETFRTSSKIQEQYKSKPNKEINTSQKNSKNSKNSQSLSPKISPKISPKLSSKVPIKTLSKKYIRREQDYNDYTSESD